jgi:two-component system, NarL family, response regulator DegU
VRRVRVLVADDHQAVREALFNLLSDVGFEVVGAAGDGVDAVALASELGPDVVLMDLSMPVLNGLDATRLLREALPDTPVVVFSAFDSAELKRHALAAGAVAYLAKDCTTQRLRATLDGAVTLAAGRLGQR